MDGQSFLQTKFLKQTKPLEPSSKVNMPNVDCTKSKMADTRPKTLNINLEDLSQMIDHSLLHPTLTDDELRVGLELCKKYNVASGTLHTPFISF